jgi:GxxExxY protein
VDDDGRTYNIIGAGMLIHRELGRGYLEATYQSALAIEFEERGLPFLEQVPIDVWFRGRQLGGTYRADFVCYGDIIVELKALPSIGRAEVSQLAPLPHRDRSAARSPAEFRGRQPAIPTCPASSFDPRGTSAD